MMDDDHPLRQSLFELANALRSEQRESAASIPETLYHYTTTAGFHGIVTSKSIWASFSLLSNDRQEGKYGLQMARKAFDRVAAGRSERIRTACLLGLAGSENYPWACYITCFTRISDLLSQWRGYGDDGAGFCLGIQSTRIPRTAALAANHYRVPSQFLLPVIYGENEQNAILEGAMQRTLDVFERHSGGVNEDDIAWEYSTFMAYVVHLLALTFKNPAFAEEAEWRLVRICSMTDPAPDVKYRTIGSSIVPYFSLNLALPSAPEFIKELVVGPAHNFDLTCKTLRLYLKSHEHNPDLNWPKLQESKCSYAGRSKS